MPFFYILLAVVVLVILARLLREEESDELKQLRMKAENGDPASMLELSDCYGLGKLGAARDIARSVAWTERAANSHDYAVSKKASSQLAFLFSLGVGELERPEQALFWSERAYELGDHTAVVFCVSNHRRLGNIKKAYQYALAGARWKMNQKEIDEVEADYAKLLTPAELETCRKEAEDLDPLNRMKAKGDKILSQSLMLLAATGDQDSMHELALQLLEGGMGLPKNKEAAISWLNRAAAGGHQKSQEKLAEMNGK
jgi:TPR repeat protein